ncbi:MAG TPA: hypothetical protein PLS49_07895 [Candidatus Woesebacteria bacterium]|nr:hypothetical protein [Candidatus Woesebacteria bacterium]
MKRQKVSIIKPEESFAVEFYPGVIKFILGNKVYYATCAEFVNQTVGKQAELVILPHTQSGNDAEVLKQVKDHGVSAVLVAYLEEVSLSGQDCLFVQIMNEYAVVKYSLKMNKEEFEENFQEAITNQPVYV